jgi:hypothetical protein
MEITCEAREKMRELDGARKLGKRSEATKRDSTPAIFDRLISHPQTPIRVTWGKDLLYLSVVRDINKVSRFAKSPVIKSRKMKLGNV